MSWYRTYRPTTISGLHLTSVRTALLDMMAKGRFPHAMLFAGPKGTGKTSSARIVSALLNDSQNAEQVEALFFKQAVPSSGTGAAPESVKKNKPFVEPSDSDPIVQRIYRGASFVVQEMDAASHRGIDDIRELRERVYLPPQEGKVSVYILDEVHMLTTEAFNALLKILEEPPAHVVFILATTEIHKVPDTIVSRCTLVQFTKATPEELSSALRTILEKEKITFDEAAVMAIAQVADGSFRDAVKLLESCAAGKTSFTLKDVPVHLLGVSPQLIHTFIKMIINKKEEEIVDFFQKLRQDGQDPDRFFHLLLEVVHTELIQSIKGQKTVLSAKIAHFLLTHFQQVSPQHSAVIPFLGIELKTLELINKSKEKNGANGAGSGTGSAPTSTPSSSPRMSGTVASPVISKPQVTSAQPLSSDQVENIISNPMTSQVEEKLHEVLAQSQVPEYGSQDTVPAQGNGVIADGSALVQKWDEFLAALSEKNLTISSLLRSAQVVGSEEGKVKLEVYYDFHKQQLQQPKFRAIIEECIRSVVGGHIFLEFTLATRAEAGAKLSSVSGQVNEEDQLIQLAKEILV